MKPRTVTHCYRDPLNEIWMAAAYKIGLQIKRTSDAFAHSDGKGTLFIASPEYLDADDSLAQMIFHELCHSLVEGVEAFTVEDWGLDNTHEEHHFREHATLQVQATLSGHLGLRTVLAPTTDFREYYDALGDQPLLPALAPSTLLARKALRRANTNPWWPHLGRALDATATIASLASQWAAPAEAPSLYREFREPLPAHVSELPGRAPGLPEHCAECAWREDSGHCHQAGRNVPEEAKACERFEAPFDCLDCGACCRSAYHSVTIATGDAVAKRHPGLMVHHKNYSEIRRQGDHCAALTTTGTRHHCEIYEDRPTCCREFENAGLHCLTARRRLGMSL